MGNRIIFGTKYSKMDQVKFFKRCLPQILLGPFSNTLTRLYWFEKLSSSNGPTLKRSIPIKEAHIRSLVEAYSCQSFNVRSGS